MVGAILIREPSSLEPTSLIIIYVGARSCVLVNSCDDVCIVSDASETGKIPLITFLLALVVGGVHGCRDCSLSFGS